MTEEYTHEPDQSDALGEIFAALSKCQGALSGAIKESSNPFFKSKYADLHQVWETARKPLADNNLCILQPIKAINDKLYIVTILGHASGQWMKSYTPIKSQKDDAQSMGSAITYARRYGLAAMIGIAQMDDDGNGAGVAGDSDNTVNDKEPILPKYTDSQITQNKNKWIDMFSAGTSSPDQVIKMISTKYTLTAKQIKTISNLKAETENNANT